MLTLVDVREPYEYEIARIGGSRLIPLGDLETRVSDLPRAGTLVLQCHSGGRSEHAVRLLQEAGFENACNLEGGIDAWSVEIDPSVPRY
jgi:adenylyltransferase/sulfurtransferase